MKIIESINKARERGLTDKEILEEIEKQNPDKKPFFDKARERGFSSTEILDEIIKQNTEELTPEGDLEKISHKESGDAFPYTVPEENNTTKEIPRKPSEKSKLWSRIFITIILSSLAAFSFTTVYRSFLITEVEPVYPEIIQRQIHIPQASRPLVKLYPERDTIERIAISSNEEYFMYLEKLLEYETEKELVRIIVEDHREGEPLRIINFEDFFQAFSINPPQLFFQRISNDFDFYIYIQEEKNSLIFVSNFSNQYREEVEWNIMRPWEGRIEQDFQRLFSFLGESIETTNSELETTSIRISPTRQINVRYRETEEDRGLYYAIADERLFFSTSLEAVELIIQRYHQL